MIAFVWERFERVRNFIVSEGFFLFFRSWSVVRGFWILRIVYVCFTCAILMWWRHFADDLCRFFFKKIYSIPQSKKSTGNQYYLDLRINRELVTAWLAACAIERKLGIIFSSFFFNTSDPNFRFDIWNFPIRNFLFLKFRRLEDLTLETLILLLRRTIGEGASWWTSISSPPRRPEAGGWPSRRRGGGSSAASRRRRWGPTSRRPSTPSPPAWTASPRTPAPRRRRAGWTSGSTTRSSATAAPASPPRPPPTWTTASSSTRRSPRRCTRRRRPATWWLLEVVGMTPSDRYALYLLSRSSFARISGQSDKNMTIWFGCKKITTDHWCTLVSLLMPWFGIAVALLLIPWFGYFIPSILNGRRKEKNWCRTLDH